MHFAKKTIFVTGVHGVGKTYFITNIIKKYTNFERISASSLIKKDIQISETDKRVKDIKHNQNIMIKKFLTIRENSDSVFLFDGHFVLVDSNGEIHDINMEVFKSLNLNEIIIFTDNIENIYTRLKNRDSDCMERLKLSKLQDREIKAARNIQKYLKIPLNIIELNGKNDDEITQQLEKILYKHKG